MSTPSGTPLDITPDIEMNPWTDLADRKTIAGQIDRIGLLRNGMESGRASVAMAIELADGSVALAETSWRLFYIAAKALMATPVAAEEPLDD